MSLKEILFPPRCVLCREYLAEECPDGLCGSCRKQMQEERALHLHRSLPYVWVAAAANYGGAMRSALLRVKSNPVRAAAEPMGELLYQAYAAQKLDFSPDIVTFVPSSVLRDRKRGFTLSEEMAKVVADRLGVPCCCTLRHTSLSAKQAGMKGKQRTHNAQKSFSLSAERDLAGKRVLLVDDILASGATINVCAQLLDQAGAAEIVGLVLAKSEKKR
jgi:ComF family protein